MRPIQVCHNKVIALLGLYSTDRDHLRIIVLIQGRILYSSFDTWKWNILIGGHEIGHGHHDGDEYKHCVPLQLQNLQSPWCCCWLDLVSAVCVTGLTSSYCSQLSCTDQMQIIICLLEWKVIIQGSDTINLFVHRHASNGWLGVRNGACSLMWGRCIFVGFRFLALFALPRRNFNCLPAKKKGAYLLVLQRRNFRT